MRIRKPGFRSLSAAGFMLAGSVSSASVAGDELYNPEAVVPPQCYTKHEGRFNPCYVCHQTHDDGERLNGMSDRRLQSEYDFLEAALKNHWTNLFIDRRSQIREISDREIIRYIAEDNFSPLAGRLESADWGGFVPRLTNLHEAGAAFDEHGFARDRSGWVAFNYKPLPSTFWPTNGSTDDVLVRLPERFRRDRQGRPSRAIYLLNLSVLEAAIKNLNWISIPATDERTVGRDLDGDGTLNTATRRLKRPDRYLGGAADTPVHAFLYPAGTEFLHTVRYVGLGDEAGTRHSQRMKEVRYMRKHTFVPPDGVRARYKTLEDEDDRGQAALRWAGDKGYDNGFGWYVQGFIENAEGSLRSQSREEGLFCMGCHRSIGATVDHTFAFARKVTGVQGWGYLNLHGMRDAPVVGESVGEILQYFRRVGGGDEFRENEELLARFFEPDHKVAEQRMKDADVERLITPSRERALQLNKAYLSIVREQSFIRGRDANITPMQNVYQQVDPETAPTLPERLQFESDIRLDWSEPAAQTAQGPGRR